MYLLFNPGRVLTPPFTCRVFLRPDPDFKEVDRKKPQKTVPNANQVLTEVQ
jgi:hypothetical protein